jgi:hypothetical protein
MDKPHPELAIIPAGHRLIDVAKLCYNANVPLLLIGPHGVGKSELLEQAAQELGIGSEVFDLSVMEPPDLVGLPRKKDGVTVYYPPARLPREGQGLLVFEELNRAPQYMRAPCLQLLTARRVNDYQLPPGWLPVASINPAEEGYEVAELDAALLSRFVKVRVKADHKEWLAWGRESGIHEDVLRYVSTDPTVFDSPESNPRAWSYVSRLLAASDGSGHRVTLRDSVAGLVGTVRAASFFRFLQGGEQPLEAKDIVEAYDQHRDQLLGWIAAGRLDLVKDSVFNLKKLLQVSSNFAKVRQDAGQLRNLRDFLTDLPGDLREEMEQFFHDHGYECPELAHRKPAGGRGARGRFKARKSP